TDAHRCKQIKSKEAQGPRPVHFMPFFYLCSSVVPKVLLLDVVAKEHVLVGDVELAVRDHRVRPGVGAAAFRLVESAQLDVLLRVSLDEEDWAILVTVVQAPVGVGN